MKDVAALEALRHVREEYNLPCEKPCVAVLLDGNVAGDHHNAAFTIGMEWRRLGLERKEVERGLRRWAKKVGWKKTNGPEKAADSVFGRTPKGDYRYHPPGFKKTTPTYKQTLEQTCIDVGCPQNCPAYSNLYTGPSSETFSRFCKLGWPAKLQQDRRYAAIEVYRALCQLEEDRGFRPGSPLFCSYAQITAKANVSRPQVGKSLKQLANDYVLIDFTPGSGSGPNARDRAASRVSRRVPIPPVSSLYYSAISTGSQRQPHIGSQRQQQKGLRLVDGGEA